MGHDSMLSTPLGSPMHRNLISRIWNEIGYRTNREKNTKLGEGFMMTEGLRKCDSL